MKLYKIYSAGGGAGDWGGVNRTFRYLPSRAKENILLKYGDVFLNHASTIRNGITREGRVNEILNLREWFYEKTGDDSAYSINILLDTGAAKITSWIQAEHSEVTPDILLVEFDRILQEINLIEHYAKVIVASNVNKAISIDIPNPFKMRAGGVNRRLNVANHLDYEMTYVTLCAKYSNELFKSLVIESNQDFAEEVLMATIDGSWSEESLKVYFDSLDFTPKNIAIGGLIGFRGESFKSAISNIINLLGDTTKYDQIHFLGCGGAKNTRYILQQVDNKDNISADVSTPINRAIDGNKSGTSVSKYYKYQEFNKMIEIREENVEYILEDNKLTSNPLFEQDELEDILSNILDHQSGTSSLDSYEARAKLIFHNYDAYQYYADNE